ncbi:HAD family hydrolase [Bosea sp. FBZP-16]|uniref:HAD family hydrolase n=1 Tax=Bosea sp. FBZP-16 TaxID=2065382 RepID=UPI0020C0E771|nr:HAD family hydrolase [Bosea sp. FBZP-16]
MDGRDKPDHDEVAVTVNLTTIGFDADDTLWQNEQFFRLTEDRFVALLGEHGEAAEISGKLLEAEKRNLAFYGFGIKGFTLSMIETALEITRGQVPPAVIGEILAAGREMLAHPVETLPHAQETLASLAGRYRLVLITKGDLFDQERKLAQSGLGDFFDAVEIVSDKSAATYEKLFARHGDGPVRSMMVGNSLKSDIVPALAAGAWAAHVPHELTWALEHAEEPAGEVRFRKLSDLGGLVDLVHEIG